MLYKNAWDSIRPSLGVMQGRLSPPQRGRIQSFPWGSWQNEFQYCNELDISLMEWTIDSYNIENNPIILPKGIREIRTLSDLYNVRVLSVTCDFFMENPPWAAEGNSEFLKRLFTKLADAAGTLETQLKLVVPLVDSGSLRSNSDFHIVLDSLNIEYLQEANCQILFETDYRPSDFKNLLADVSVRNLGVNLDTGNSASLGIDPREEVLTFERLIGNVHIKDREFRGGSVPLGSGATEMSVYLRYLMNIGYRQSFILQTARAANQDHVGEIRRSIRYLMQITEELEFES